MLYKFLLKNYLIIFYILFLTSCSKKEKIEIIEEKEIDLQMIDAYKKAEKLENQDGLTAAKKFSEAELLFPQSEVGLQEQH